MHNNVIKIKTYSRTVGKKLTHLARLLLNSELPKYTPNWQKIALEKNIHVEIGFGDGINIYNSAANNPQKLFLGIEVYANGVCNLLKLCKDKPLVNLFIYFGDADQVLDKIPNTCVAEFCIFFPDPWPKLRHKKRRLLNHTRINILKTKLQISGMIKFITDIDDYFMDVVKIFHGSSYLVFDENSLDTWHPNYILTKYHLKALDEKRRIQALQYYKK